ncbi:MULTISPECIES: type II toxin-antitoxin system HicB family antitoxin [Bacillus cereus group]|uniref:type II toxin-antitoxin system HicB family antitoxin n=1 Tax=Bacillus cereus group TaxID=86661 RepID=UPI0022E49902|nr:MULTISPECIES: type II toxin-antitoxin system HicB family antitoxin [unclassified Bacillus cereus group]MDA2667147.1 type II toxin-antitoxin system HicB family antitoxin [Bacillus cereus group sp. Bc032]MDA2677844.1 type II toxin-antitoxin system HicB family antitoxin [Bacillus cereus group sp. Bc031]MDA2683358.1 type II toxin-antitoxin system HicB family antitoxin [Bacillus cereus group sp. Bc029]MDA2688793.1 type II toxin-antitoxin system HicB family antitoxin [Bacillus cereus group sp. Bc0
MKKDYYVYPAILEKSSDGYGIYFPDLPGCVSHADTQEDALKEGREALGLHLSGMEEDNDPIPEPSTIESVELEQDEYAFLIDVWMPPLRKQDKLVYKRKNVTLPSYLEEHAAKQNVNFSEMLVEALEQHLGYKEKKNTP